MENYDTASVHSSSSEALNLPIDLGSAYRSPVQTPLQRVYSYRVKNVTVPRTYYTIKDNSFYFGLQGNVTGPVSMQIPAGNYTFVQLATYIQTTWFSTFGTSITVDFNQPNFKTRITRTGGVDATIAITAVQRALPGFSSTLGYYQDIAPNTILDASNTFHITGPSDILVCSNTLASNGTLRLDSVLHDGYDGRYIKDNVIMMMPGVGNSGAFVSSQIPGEWQQFAIPRSITSLDFYLIDQDGVAIDLNGYSWSIQVEFRMEKGAN